MGPGSRRKGCRNRRRLVRRHPRRQDRGRRLPHLIDRLSSDIGQDQRFVVDLSHWLVGHDLQDGGGGELANLGIDRAKDGMIAHHDLVGGKRDKRTAGHRMMRNEDRDLAAMRLDRPGDLKRRKHEPAGRMEHDVQRRVPVRHPDRAQNVLAVLDVDVAHQRKAQKPHGFLPVHHQDHPAAAAFLEAVDHLHAPKVQELARQDGLQHRQDDEDP